MYSDPKAKIATAEDLLASMGESGVDISVALGFAWQDRHDIVRHNDYLLENAARSDGRIIPFATVNMGDTRAEVEMERCGVGRARGIGELRPENQGWNLATDEGARLATVAARAGLVLLFHVTEPGDRSYPGRAGCTLEAFAAFSRRYPNVKIVGAHLGGGLYTEVDDAPPVFVDTAAQPFLYRGEAGREAFATVPADRLLFGSDFPLISQARQITEISTVISAGDTRDRVLGRNARELLGL
jgi:predicted TIM-barrel fold metal-dependent hydrolase